MVQIASIPCGKDLSVTITGGTEAHIGAVAIGIGRLPDERPMQYSASVSVITVPDHKDDVVAKLVAKDLADFLHANVTVACGIHIDGAKPEELILLQDNVKNALQKLKEQL